MEKASFLSEITSLANPKAQDRWPELLDEIDRGNVIPVIGPNLLVEPRVLENGLTENLHQQLISVIAPLTGVKSRPRTFSQLVYDDNFRYTFAKDNIDVIYRIIDKAMGLPDGNGINFEPSPLLVELLGTKRFPFVITTSFTPIVERAMERIWGRVNVLTFNNDPNGKSNDAGYRHDISSAEDLKRPTVFYMLGRYCQYPEYAVTDSDMMNYCASWIKGEGVPNVLINELNAWDNENDKSKRYLLFLGNSYSDWLYRFVWFALRTRHKVMQSDVIVNERAEDTLVQFLERLQTFYQDNPSEVIHRISKEMDARHGDHSHFVGVTDYDVFISYSRRDKLIAQNLLDALKAKGFNVWFDNVSIGIENWKEAIERGITHSQVFVPILSANVKNESLTPHEYRAEWDIAAELSKRMGGRTFIIPLAEKGFDFNDPITKLPKPLAEMNACWYTSADDLGPITQAVVNEIQKLKRLSQNH